MLYKYKISDEPVQGQVWIIIGSMAIVGGIIAILTWSGSTVDIAHSEFIYNNYYYCAMVPFSMESSTFILFYGDQISLSHCELRY